MSIYVSMYRRQDLTVTFPVGNCFSTQCFKKVSQHWFATGPTVQNISYVSISLIYVAIQLWLKSIKSYVH